MRMMDKWMKVGAELSIRVKLITSSPSIACGRVGMLGDVKPTYLACLSPTKHIWYITKILNPNLENHNSKNPPLIPLTP
jgi:hypothetical protein